MNNPDYGVHFVQINVSKVPTFVFTLPEQETGRNDILIFVDFFACKDGNIEYHAWAQIDGDGIRFFVASNKIQCPQDSTQLEGAIINDLNTSSAFHERLVAFLQLRFSQLEMDKEND